MLEEDARSGGELGAVCWQEATWRWPLVPQIFPSPLPTAPRAESGRTRDIRCASASSAACVCGTMGMATGSGRRMSALSIPKPAAGWQHNPPQSCFPNTLSPGRLVVTLTPRPCVFPALGAAVGLGAKPRLSRSFLRAVLHKYKWVRGRCFVKWHYRNNDLISAIYK